MKDQDFSEEVNRILQEAPSARLMLLQNYQNLNDVADYCTKNYLESGKDSAQALEETKNFTSQSLASVAYQISTLANSVLQLLDAQTNQLRHMESSVNLIGQTVCMHREKVCRREIGAFTVVKRVARGHKLLPPQRDITTAETRPPRYSRQPISYSHLDGLGHGVKVAGKQTTGGNHGNQPTNSNQPGSHGGTISRIKSTKPPEPVQCPVAPPTVSSRYSSFGNPVAPPTVAPHWPASSSSDGDIIKTLLDEAPPLPVVEEQTQGDDVTADAPPPPLLQPADLSVAPVAPPPPPPQVVSSNHSVDGCVVPPPPQIVSNQSVAGSIVPPPSPPPCLETVVEENSFPPPADDIMPPPTNQETELDLPAPPPPPPPAEDEVRRSGGRRSLSTARSLSLRLRPRPATRSLFSQSLMIPPPPSYPPPVAPPPSSRLIGGSSPRLRSLPARLQHLDLEIPAPPPPALFDEVGGFDDDITMPLPLFDDITMPLPLFDDITMPLPPPMDATPPDMEKVVALWPYEALKEDELSFQEGDVITLTHRHGDGWCEGVAADGRRGFFPESYVGQSEG